MLSCRLKRPRHPATAGYSPVACSPRSSAAPSRQQIADPPRAEFGPFRSIPNKSLCAWCLFLFLFFFHFFSLGSLNLSLLLLFFHLCLAPLVSSLLPLLPLLHSPPVLYTAAAATITAPSSLFPPSESLTSCCCFIEAAVSCGCQLRCCQHADSQRQALQKHYHALDRKQRLFFSMLEALTLDPDSLTPLLFPSPVSVTCYESRAPRN